MNTKVALITGAARRTGAEIAKVLHAKGFNIVVHYLNSKDEANTLVNTFNSVRRDSAIAMALDLRQVSQFDEFIAKIVTKWHRLDLLVNNASTFLPTPMGKVTDASWHALHDSNVKGPFFLAQAAFKVLKATQGNIVNITDIHAKQPFKDYSAYCISKAGLVMATKVLAKEFAPDVRVNAIAPGAISWPEGTNTLDQTIKNKILQRIPLGRVGSPQVIAKTVLFLSENDYITGETITVDGGRSLHL